MYRSLLFAVAVILTMNTQVAKGEAIISAFEGSTLVGEASQDFVELPIVVTSGASALSTEKLEGRLYSRVWTKPAEKSPLEVYRSYQRELEAAGFETVTALPNGERRVKSVVWEMFRTAPRFDDRPYMIDGKKSPRGRLGFLFTFTEWYLLARKTTDESTIHVAVMISSKKDLYAVDVLHSAAMETGTVTLNADGLRSALEQSGKVAIYDILFDTNADQIRSESESALQVIAQVLKEHADRRFFVVGHTDGTGDLDHNVSLSNRRANAVVKALVGQHGIAPDQLAPRGVGPLAPVGSNDTEAGRSQNRRVELVVRL